MIQSAPLPPSAVGQHPAPPSPWTDLRPRLAGFGAVAFAGIVVLQNIARGGSAPANDASAADVLDHFADHRGLTVFLAATFVASGAALLTFLGGGLRRMSTAGRPGWAFTGYAAAVAVIALFAIVMGTEQALSVVAHGDNPDLGAVQALWALHNSVFTVLHLMVAMALLGLAKAGVAAGVTPRVFERLAPVGAVLLATSAIAGPFIAAGEAMPVFGVGLVGFLVWLAFLVTTGTRMMRGGDTIGAGR